MLLLTLLYFPEEGYYYVGNSCYRNKDKKSQKYESKFGNLRRMLVILLVIFLTMILGKYFDQNDGGEMLKWSLEIMMRVIKLIW